MYLNMPERCSKNQQVELQDVAEQQGGAESGVLDGHQSDEQTDVTEAPECLDPRQTEEAATSPD